MRVYKGGPSLGGPQLELIEVEPDVEEEESHTAVDAPPAPLPGVRKAVCVKVDENNEAQIKCPAATKLKSIDFASFGRPGGDCNTGFSVFAGCHLASTKEAVLELCGGKEVCTFTLSVSEKAFAADPCYGQSKWLAVHGVCA